MGSGDDKFDLDVQGNDYSIGANKSLLKAGSGMIN